MYFAGFFKLYQWYQIAQSVTHANTSSYKRVTPGKKMQAKWLPIMTLLWQRKEKKFQWPNEIIKNLVETCYKEIRKSRAKFSEIETIYFGPEVLSAKPVGMTGEEF